MHQGWPKLVASMWMATNDNGLALVTYGPSVVKALVGKGKEVTIEETTDYPFRGSVQLTIRSGEPVRFPLTLRIPGWADSAVIKFRNREIVVKGTSSYRMNEKWVNGDQVNIMIPMEIRAEKRFNNSLSILKGPLYYSLRIAKEFKPVKIKFDNYGYKGSIDWEINPVSSWNYGLLFDSRNPGRGLIVRENPIGKYPFSDTGDMIWSADSAKYIVSANEAPVVIRMRGMKIAGWGLKENSADIPPGSPVVPEGSIEQIDLVPYGCARLRITEFPVIDVILMEDEIRPSR